VPTAAPLASTFADAREGSRTVVEKAGGYET
jgi:hypothetical protein